MKIYTSKKNKQIDSYAINVLGIPGVELMYTAAQKIADTVRRCIPPYNKICVVCGNGNNAGDGFAVAPILAGYGYTVSVLCCNDKEFTPDAEYYFERLDGVPIYRYTDDKSEALDLIYETDAVIDAIYGNGFRGSLDEDCSAVANAVNNSNALVFAVDIPSGCVCNNGRVEGVAIKADITVALSTMKPCYYLYPACEFCGKVELNDIGIPEEAYESVENDGFEVTEELCASLLLDRPSNSHKGTFGKLLLVCGSEDMPGAAKLALSGALRSGVGLAKLASLKSVCDKAGAKYDEPVFSPYDDFEELTEDIENLCADCNAVVVGCGLGRSDGAEEVVESIIAKTEIPLLIDADGINLLKPNINILNGRNGGCVITPHPKELSNLIEMSVGEIQSDRMGNALKTAKELNAVTVLKGAHTVIAAPDGTVYINTTGNSGLAKGGSGDVLSGLIGSFLAQGYSPKDAAVLGVYIHGKAGDICAQNMGEESMLPSDLPLYFSKVFKGLK